MKVWFQNRRAKWRKQARLQLLQDAWRMRCLGISPSPLILAGKWTKLKNIHIVYVLHNAYVKDDQVPHRCLERLHHRKKLIQFLHQVLLLHVHAHREQKVQVHKVLEVLEAPVHSHQVVPMTYHNARIQHRVWNSLI